MLIPSTLKDGQAIILLEHLPSIQRIAIEQADIDLQQAIPYATYRTWYIDVFYPNKEKQVSYLTAWLSNLVQNHKQLKGLNKHRKTQLTYVEQRDNDAYYLRAKVYDMPRSEGCKVEAKVVKGEITHFEVLSYFPFQHHHEKNTPCPWKAFTVLGQKDGPFTMFHPDGSLLQTGAFNSGKRAGLWTRYSQDETLIESRVYSFVGIL